MWRSSPVLHDARLTLWSVIQTRVISEPELRPPITPELFCRYPSRMRLKFSTPNDHDGHSYACLTQVPRPPPHLVQSIRWQWRIARLAGHSEEFHRSVLGASDASNLRRPQCD